MWSLAKILSVPKKVASKIFLRVYIEEEGDGAVKNKYTLNQIGEALFKHINDFEEYKKQSSAEFNDFKKETRDNFKELRQEVKSINDRLDYIVKANKLKDLPKTKK